MRGISWLAANRLASQEGLCTVEWVSNWERPRYNLLMLLLVHTYVTNGTYRNTNSPQNQWANLLGSKGMWVEKGVTNKKHVNRTVKDVNEDIQKCVHILPRCTNTWDFFSRPHIKKSFSWFIILHYQRQNTTPKWWRRSDSHYYYYYYYYLYPPLVALRPTAGHGLLSLEVSRSDTTTHYGR